MKKYFPILEWLPKYTKSDFTGDLSAGLTVGVMLIPQGMAYAMLAGLPPIYGLYTSTLPLIIYGILGTSRQLAVGPVAMVGLLIYSGVGKLAVQGSDQFISYAILLALMVGVIQFLMGAFRLGFLVNFLSHPVIAGFTSAAAVIIGFSQLKHLLGIDIPRGKVHETILNIIDNIQHINIPTMMVGIGSIILLILMRRISKKIPGPLIVVFLGMAAVYLLGLHEQGVKIVKDIPEGLPSFDIPGIDIHAISTLMPIALTISFVGFMESIAVAKAIQSKHKNYEVIPNQELIALGVVNIISSFFKSFPAQGGFGRSAVNDQAGAKTGIASFISAMVIVVTLLFFTKYFYYLPKAVLAAIIIVAVFGLIDHIEAKNLWGTDRKDFWVFMVTALATLAVGVEEGILVGVILSLAMLIYKVSYPHIAELGRVPGSNEYKNIERFDNLHTNDNILIIRFDARLFFANANSLRDYVLEKVKLRPDIKHIIIDCSSISSVDSSAIHMIRDLVEILHRDGREIYLSEVKGPVRDTLKINGILKDSNINHFYLSNRDAVRDLKYKEGNKFTDIMSQTKIEE